LAYFFDNIKIHLRTIRFKRTMINHYKIIFILIFTAFTTQAQQQTVKVLKGKVIANSYDLDGIYVVNLRSDVSTLTENAGYFSIPAIEGDTLLFSHVQLKGLKIVLKKNDFDVPLFFVKMEVLLRQLDEVTINQYKNINAVSLRILSKPAKKYTPAERKLRTAEELHWYSPLLIPVGGMSVDGMINSISGRTAMLQKELVIERKEFLHKKITDQFKEEYFTETLKIPAEYVKGFHYYLVEDKEFVAALNDKNTTMATFIMNRLAVDYLQLLDKKQ
jgi:hypothetical protein